jgi:hypothetical protein
VGVAISAAEVAVGAIEAVALLEEDTMVHILYTFVDGILIRYLSGGRGGGRGGFDGM